MIMSKVKSKKMNKDQLVGLVFQVQLKGGYITFKGDPAEKTAAQTAYMKRLSRLSAAKLNEYLAHYRQINPELVYYLECGCIPASKQNTPPEQDDKPLTKLFRANYHYLCDNPDSMEYYICIYTHTLCCFHMYIPMIKFNF